MNLRAAIAASEQTTNRDDPMTSTTPTDAAALDIAELARAIRAEFKEWGFRARDISVRIARFSMGESVTVELKSSDAIRAHDRIDAFLAPMGDDRTRFVHLEIDPTEALLWFTAWLDSKGSTNETVNRALTGPVGIVTPLGRWLAGPDDFAEIAIVRYADSFRIVVDGKEAPREFNRAHNTDSDDTTLDNLTAIALWAAVHSDELLGPKGRKAARAAQEASEAAQETNEPEADPLPGILQNVEWFGPIDRIMAALRAHPDPDVSLMLATYRGQRVEVSLDRSCGTLTLKTADKTASANIERLTPRNVAAFLRDHPEQYPDPELNHFPEGDPFPIVSIEFRWSESNAVTDGTTVNSVWEADRILSRIRQKCTPGGGYDKTSILIRYKDDLGETSEYQGRWDVTRNSDFAIAQHFELIASYLKGAGKDHPIYRNSNLGRIATALANRGFSTLDPAPARPPARIRAALAMMGE